MKFLHMTQLSDPKLNYESKWANLTFEIKARSGFKAPMKMSAAFLSAASKLHERPN